MKQRLANLQLQQSFYKYLVEGSLAALLGFLVIMTTFGMDISTTYAQPTHAYNSKNTVITSIIDDVFGADAPSARRIAMCESSMNPNATNTMSIGGNHAAGLFQILYPSTWNSTSQAGSSPYDARANTIAAHEIFMRDGYSWREWSCSS